MFFAKYNGYDLSAVGFVVFQSLSTTPTIFTSLHAGDNMPIGGIVITVRPDDRQNTEVALAGFSELSVYGSDEKGNIIAMLKGNDPESIEEAIMAIEAIDTVLEVNLVYLNAECGGRGEYT